MKMLKILTKLKKILGHIYVGSINTIPQYFSSGSRFKKKKKKGSINTKMLKWVY